MGRQHTVQKHDNFRALGRLAALIFDGLCSRWDERSSTDNLSTGLRKPVPDGSNSLGLVALWSAEDEAVTFPEDTK